MTQDSGVKINLISRETIMSMDSETKINFIIEQVMKGTVLVLETGLTPVEEAELYRRVMENIDSSTFIGIEIQGIAPADILKRNWLDKILNRSRKELPRMSVIGPAQMLRTIYKDGHEIQAVILTKEGEEEVSTPDGVGGGGTPVEDDTEELFEGIGESRSEGEGLRPVPSNIKGAGFARVVKKEETEE